MHTTLKCAACGHLHAIDVPQNVCVRCGRPLLAEYRLNELAATFTPERVRARCIRSLWRFWEVLPVDRPEDAVSMGEGVTPLVSVRGKGPLSEFRRLFVKDESFNPTGSFKARGMAAAITRAKALGTTTVILPSAGNAGGAAASYAARAGMRCFVFMPEDTPSSNIVEAVVAGASVVLVKGLINDCGKIVRQACERFGWFDLSTLKEPFRAEGKKTMGYELAFDFADEAGDDRLTLPDVIFYPTGGGTGLIGMWKAFDEMQQLGWIDSRRPRMVAVQAENCALIVRAFQQGESHAQVFSNASTVASGLRVPAAIGDFLMLQALRASQGTAISVSDRDLLAGTAEMSQALGNFVCPEAGAVWSAAQRLAQDGWIRPEEKIVLFNTGTGLKYGHLFPPGKLPVLDPARAEGFGALGPRGRVMSIAEGISRLAETESANLRQLVESLDQIFFLVASDMSRVYYISPAYERITGYSCETLCQNPRAWTKLIHDEDRDFVLKRVSDRLEGVVQGRTELEYRIQTASGEVRWLRVIQSPVCDESGQIERLAGIAEDITSRKQTEAALKEIHADLARQVEVRTQELSQTVFGFEREISQRRQVEAELRRSEARFRRLFEANIIGVMFSDIYGNVTDVNEAFLQMTGYSRADLPLRWDKMTPPEWFHLSQLSLEQMVRSGTVKPIEKEYIRKDGSRVPVLIGGALLDRENWRCVFFVLDLTQRRLAEEQVREVSLQLEHASRLSVMGELLADMAHEIHQPLGVITNYANGTLRRLKNKQLKRRDLKERLRDIAAQSMRVAKIMRRIREFILRREPDRKPVNLNTILMDALQFTRFERREHRVAVMVRPDRDLPMVQADPVQMTQVLVNLLSNAIQAVSDPRCEFPKILISTFVNDDDMAEIAVADNGPGVAPEVAKKIFDRFYTTKSSGLGLGLPISKSIVESHGGQLTCDSQPGESTVFRVSLPTHKAPVENPQ